MITQVQTPQTFCRVGVARGDVTPRVGIYHRMWGAAVHDRSTGVHRPLTATVMALRPAAGRGQAAVDAGDDGGIVLVVLDHCILAEEDLANIRRRVAGSTTFPAGAVHVSLTHTHGAGLMMRDRVDSPGGDLIVPYLEDLAHRVGEFAREAERRLRDAWVVYGTGRCDLAAHRDFFDEQTGRFVCGFNPGQPADDTVVVARVTDDGGRTVATVVNYACHPTTLAWENTLISPDYVGATREVVEGATGGAPCLFFQGASGELGPREGYVGDAAVADRNGCRLGYAALSALESLPPGGTRFEYRGPVVSGAVLGTWGHAPLGPEGVARASAWLRHSWTMNLSYRSDLPTLEQSLAERGRLVAQEEAARRGGGAGAARDLRARVEQVTRQIMRLEALPPGDAFPLPVTTLQLGGAVWVLVAGEHYSVLQTELRRRFPQVPVIVATVTDGWQPGYLPTAQTYGKGIYQESICMVAPGSLEKVIAEVGAQIGQWAAPDGAE